MNPQLIYYICGATAAVVTVLLGVGGAIWNLSSKLSGLETGLSTIKDNHLAHVQKDIDEIKATNKMFVEYIIRKG